MMYLIVFLFLVLIQIVIVSEIITLRKKINKNYKYFQNKEDVIDDLIYFIVLNIVILFIIYIGS